MPALSAFHWCVLKWLLLVHCKVEEQQWKPQDNVIISMVKILFICVFCISYKFHSWIRAIESEKYFHLMKQSEGIVRNIHPHYKEFYPCLKEMASAKVLPLLRVKISSSLSCNWLDSPWLYHDDCVCCRAAKNCVSVFAQKPRVVLKENSTSNWLTASSSFESPPISWRCLLKFRWTMQTFIHLFPLELEQWPWRIQLLRL